MQTASTNICERMGRSQELSELKRGTVIGCHLCNKSIRDISLLLNIPRSTVSGIVTKQKQLRSATATQPPTTEFLSSGDVFFGVTNHTSLCGNPMEVSTFGDCQENCTCLTVLCQV
ncbi:unnamed protein product [Staurois parvus]|uniref:Uncharacterized protein n=1 Tax=Staurois parvus TaxID=386267 RepID=A0ABN9DG48_9NEOB|nr:unnamed protein product [Staurois parvus]